MLMHLAVARETARGLGKKTHGTGLLEHTFAFYKDINMTGAQWWKRRKNYPGSEEKFVLVMVMDPNWVRQAGEERQLCTQWLLNHINGTFLTDCTARKTDINIFEEDMHGANGDMTVSLVSVLYQCFTKSVPLALQRKIVCVPSQELTLTVHFWKEVEEK